MTITSGKKDSAGTAGPDREGKYLTFTLADEDYGIGILKIKEIIGMMPITTVPQTPEFVKEISKNSNLGIIKQIPIVDDNSISVAETYADLVDAILLDTKAGSEVGGTGKTHNWDISREIVSSINKPVILAGGLNPDNVANAIKKVKPYAVDVSSGVESEPGIKDSEKMKRFIQNATK